MDSNNGPALIWGITMVVLLIGSLAARRLPFAQIVRNLLIWALIFALAYGVFLFKDEIGGVWDRARADLTGERQLAGSGQTMVLQRVDGHFFADATINGRPVHFLVDTGATVTTINPETARDSGVEVSRIGFPLVVETANGLANSWPATAGELRIGSISFTELDVHVSELPGSTNLLGMNALAQLSSWEVRGDQMILRP